MLKKYMRLQAGDAKSDQLEDFDNNATRLIDKALIADPGYRKAYYFGTLVACQQGNYARAWKIVKKTHATNSYKFDKNFWTC